MKANLWTLKALYFRQFRVHYEFIFICKFTEKQQKKSSSKRSPFLCKSLFLKSSQGKKKKIVLIMQQRVIKVGEFSPRDS